ncbi:MAG: hypothetical protein ACRBN8_34065 [Nannocystales bacterium]
MLQLTHRQFAALAFGKLSQELREQVFEGLVENEYCEAEALEDPTLRDELHRQIEAAARHGIASVEGYVEFLSHGFQHDEGWMQRPAVQALLNGEARAESEMLSALYSALARK